MSCGDLYKATEKMRRSRGGEGSRYQCRVCAFLLGEEGRKGDVERIKGEEFIKNEIARSTDGPR